MGVLILGVNTLYRLFCFFKLFLMVGKGLIDATVLATLAIGNTNTFIILSVLPCRMKLLVQKISSLVCH